MIYAIIAIVLVGLFFMFTYNGLVALRQRVKNAWSQVDVQLRRRYDLIPNLVNTIKGYAKHERETFQQVTEARTRAMSAGTVKEQANAENMLSGTLKSLFAVAENYPQLKADSNFKQLQEELSNTESKIAFARQFYNDTVQKYNTKIQVFPNVLIAGMLGFTEETYFNLDGEAAARQPVDVKFD
ncbi:LemA family protein [Dethiobacter alkaliphilus]|uniref:LemA family protein n=1 Tax=Dethiobacter alkaliphilus TaxID=427926 RepID=UPI00222676EA|nr:LemA family protein [Dethiobacter alkaliphilus]MCW3490164.1 LemA family protein [Dethiobacter alkaliphilus]